MGETYAIEVLALEECLEQAGGFPFLAQSAPGGYLNLFVCKEDIAGVESFVSNMYECGSSWNQCRSSFISDDYKSWSLIDYFEPEPPFDPQALTKPIVIPDCWCRNEKKCKTNCKYAEFRRRRGGLKGKKSNLITTKTGHTRTATAIRQTIARGLNE